jgi:hypothetical protein
MIESDRQNAKPARLGGGSAAGENLPYRIELWTANKVTVERVLARAVNATLARAIFNAARTEHPERLIVLRRGARVIAECE